MARGTKSRLAALGACLLALALLAPASAGAASAPAVEQYVNTLPGVPGVDITQSDPIVARAQRVGPVGVVGERDGSVTVARRGRLGGGDPRRDRAGRRVRRRCRTGPLASPGAPMRCVAVAAIALLATIAIGCGDSSDPAADPGDPFYGVAPQGATGDADLARMSSGKLGSYHLLLSWGQTEIEDGAYKYSDLDTLLTGLALNGLKPITYVYGTPDWLAKTENTPPTSKEELAAFRDYLTTMATRYGPDGSFWKDFERAHPGVPPQPIEIWEIWNEVNGPAFWAPEPDPSAYAQLLRVSERTLHKVDPEAQIMVAGHVRDPLQRGRDQVVRLPPQALQPSPASPTRSTWSASTPMGRTWAPSATRWSRRSRRWTRAAPATRASG